MACVDNLLSNLVTMTNLVKNFKDEFLNPEAWKRTEYDSILDFLIDLLKPLGLTPWDVLSLLLSKIGGVSEKTIEIIRNSRDKFAQGVGEAREAMMELDEKYDTSVLMDIEEGVKYTLAAALAAIPTCSSNIFIGDKFMDPHVAINAGGDNVNVEGGIIIPISEIDPFNYLFNCPLSTAGRGYYHDCSELTIPTLYRSMDMNAFLWYCKNRSLDYPQAEVNKTMWDNRFINRRKGRKSGNTGAITPEEERSPEEWKEWINSKKDKYFNRGTNNNNNNGALSLDSRGEKNNFKPIVQIRTTRTIEPSFLVQISSQNYYRIRKIFTTHRKDIDGNDISSGMAFNKTLLEFNMDYLRSIRIFSSGAIVNNIIDSFLGGSYYDAVQFNISKVLSREKVKQVVHKVIDLGSAEVTDCYFSFTNEEFDEMMKNIELMKYSAKKRNDAEGNIKEFDTKEIDDLKESIFNPDEGATLHDERKTIEKGILDLSSVPAKGGVESGLDVDVASNWLEELITTVVMSLITPVLSPKVNLILALNRHILGIDDETNIISQQELIQRMLSVILSCMIYIIKEVIRYLLEYILSLYTKSIAIYVIMRTTEMITNYLEVLRMAFITCVPKIDLKNTFSGTIMTDNSADILAPEKTRPDSVSGC